MQIKKRDMKLTGTKDGCKKYFSKEKTFGQSTGVVSIIRFKKIDTPTEVHYNFKDETIIDSNYTWIQIAIKDSNFWVKAMFDSDNKPIETYIDVVRSIDFNDITNPVYEDLFLDIIIPNKGHIYQMDDVELMKAYREGVITEDEYKLSKIVCKNLIKYLDNNLKQFFEFIDNLKKELEDDIKTKGEDI